MKVFLTGASGYVGQAIIRSLRSRGHQVSGLVRSDTSAAKVAALGAEPVRGDIRDLALLQAQTATSDGTVHTAFEFTPDVATVDREATLAMLEALKGSGKPFIYTSGAWIYGPTHGRLVDENSPLDVPAIYQLTQRSDVEALVRSYAQQGVRTIVTRGGLAYGCGGGPLNLFLSQLQGGRTLRHVGAGMNHFPAVHVDDFAELYALALEKAPAGAVYNVTDGVLMTYKELFELLARANGDDIAVEPWPLEDARHVLAQFADAFTMDQQVSSRKATQELGWSPRAPGLKQEIASSAYKH
jgi:nucleoside-diphosphate-sugar epimerase